MKHSFKTTIQTTITPITIIASLVLMLFLSTDNTYCSKHRSHKDCDKKRELEPSYLEEYSPRREKKRLREEERNQRMKREAKHKENERRKRELELKEQIVRPIPSSEMIKSLPTPYSHSQKKNKPDTKDSIMPPSKQNQELPPPPSFFDKTSIENKNSQNLNIPGMLPPPPPPVPVAPAPPAPSAPSTPEAPSMPTPSMPTAPSMPTPPAPSAPSAPSMPTTSLIPESFMPSAPSMPTPPAPPAPSAPSAPEAPSMPTPSMPTAPSMPTPPAPSAPSAPSAPTPSLIPESFMTSAPSMPTPPTPPAPSVSTPPAPSMPSAPSMPTPPAQNAPTPSLIPESFMTSAPSVPTPPAPTAPAIPAHIPPAVIASAEAQNSSTPPAQTLDQSSGDITITPIETSTLDIVELGPDTSEIIEQPLDEYLPQEEYSNDIDEITSNKTYGEEDWMTWISKEAATISAEIEEQEANQEPIEQEEDMLPINPISEDYAINYAPDNINREAPEPVLYYRRDLYPEPIQIDDNYDELYL